MNIESSLNWVDNLIYNYNQTHLNNLQRIIISQVLLGKKYLEIAEAYGYTEGHIKDIASEIWKLLSEICKEKVRKSNFKSLLKRKLSSLSLPQTTVSSPNFLGREKVMARFNKLFRQGHKIIVIQGEGGIGKTTLAQNYFKQGNFEVVLELLMAKETANIISIQGVIEEWLKQDLQIESGHELGISLSRLKRYLKSRKVGILIDNLEPALDKDGKFISPHRNYLELLRILGDSQLESLTLITSRYRLCEPDLNLTHFRLSGLELKAWQDYFSGSSITLNLEILTKLHQIYGGNAKAMTIIASAISEEFAGNMQAYWQENQEYPLVKIGLKNLISSQFDHLKSLDREAYNLLCRLGCYRYQDIAEIEKKGVLALLWDVDILKQHQVIESLINRSLVEFNQGKYFLHPVIRSEGIRRLKSNKTWEMVNQKVAEFFTNTVQKILTIQDATTALEAYYHYLEIGYYQQAAEVILKSRDNQWGQFLPLGSTLYRLGLIQPILVAINHIIPNIDNPKYLAELYNILGDLFWIKGDIHQAINCQEKTITMAKAELKQVEINAQNKHNLYYLKMLEVDSILSIGLYYIDLWELELAAVALKKVINLTSNTDHYKWGEKATLALALVNSYLGFKEKAISATDTFYTEILNNKYTGRFSYFMQILGQIYVNLGQYNRALKILTITLNFAQESCYKQIKGKTFLSLGEIYRQQKDIKTAIFYQLKAINIFTEIDAKCDLAKAYFQLALSYQNQANIQQTNFYKQIALKLFQKMQAHQQIRKIKTYFS